MSHFRLLLLVCFIPAILLSDALAQNQSDDDAQIEKQRKLFAKAESVAAVPKGQQFKYLQAQLEGYPLAPYIELKTLVAFPYLSNKERIDTFLTQYNGTPMDRPLRKRWLKYLAKKGQGALFLHYYRDQGDAELACKNLQFKLEREDLREETLQKVGAFWLVGNSQPKACDPVFKQWQDAGLRTQDHVWKRLSLAADGGKHTLIPYLKRLLPDDQKYLADLWLKVRRSPSYVSRTSRFPGKFAEKESEILSYGLSRLVWNDRDLALKSWQAITKRFTFTEQQQQKVANKFAVALAIADHDKAELWLERANKLLEDDELFRWHLAHVLRHQNWQHAIDVIDLAPDSISDGNSYQYWQARAYEEVDAQALAHQKYETLSKNRHYYGFLASGKLARAPTIVDKPLIFSEQELNSVSNLPAAKRAFEFLKLKRYTSARREWIYLQGQLNTTQKLMSAVLADNWGWHDQAIFGFARAGYMDDVKRRFPLAYSEHLVKSAQQNNLDPAWAFAIARRESSFMADANSGAGARGLMQLMPGTARYLAKKKVNNRSLYDPAQNSQFGTQYMRYLLDKMNDNPILATASYNAGWRRVKNWIPEKGSLPMDIWIETIPYKETRNYVKAVLAYKQIYSQQLGQESTLFENLANMQLPAGYLK